MFTYRFNPLLALSCGLISLTLSYANTQQAQFDQTLVDVQHIAQNTIDSGKLNDFNVNDFATGDIHNVPAMQYLDNPHLMDTDKQNAFLNNEDAQALMLANNTNKVTINPNDPIYQHVVDIQNNADKILSDSGDEYTCQEVSGSCVDETVTRTCQQSNYQNINCIRYPQIDLIDKTIPAYDQSFSGTGKTDYRHEPYHAGASFSYPYTGKLKSLTITATATGTYGGGWFGHYWINISPIVNRIDTRLYQQSITYTFNNLDIWVTQGQKSSFYADGREYATVPDVVINFTGVIEIPPRIEKEAQITWKDTCNNVNGSACVKTYEACTEQGGIKNIGGVEVNLPCWQYALSYKCGYNVLNTCQAFENKCSLVDQRCIEEDGGFCLTHEKTYQCTEQSCENVDLVCGNPNSITFTQEITSGNKGDFLHAVAAFAGVNEAASDVKDSQDQINIFKGKSANCGEAALGVYDCCDGDGNIIRNCSESEQALREDRNKGKAIYAGRYCGKKVAGVCLVHHQSFCVYDSKLTRIIHEQGRIGQLGIGLGDAKHPNCSGMTPEQLQAINFDKINFEEVYAEIEAAATLPTDALANALSGKFGSGNALPEINKQQGNSLPSR
ncbi:MULTISPECIES: conjugal transfer protein TraN [Cysteiniphilum]|uniref:conjugal transfer protein TraN n=1 Tax=Cysteiniphilum TaxID=2056696 RepID=UPI001784C3B0|nr:MULTISPECIES: conjugal transfer protein TraN [Cysteiniphilum]